ncbi:MAG: hypothetical protein MAG715_00234 [Methanonatronarchaeales archaeon]|nr:hypothetical protein [Methanonatronarchaeales archaeon]
MSDYAALVAAFVAAAVVLVIRGTRFRRRRRCRGGDGLFRGYCRVHVGG